MGSVIICYSDSSLFQWQGAQEGFPPPSTLPPPSPPRLATARGEERLLPQIDSSAFFKTHDWLRVGGFSKPHYLFSVMYNTHRRLRNAACDVRANVFLLFFSPFQKITGLFLRVRKQMQDSWWFVYLTSEWSPDPTDTSSWHRWPWRALSWNALSPFLLLWFSYWYSTSTFYFSALPQERSV